MSERILQALLQLFAIGAGLERLTLQSREMVEEFLGKQISLQRIPEYLALYDEYVKRFEGGDDDTRARKRIAGSSVKMLRICTEINKELNTRQKYIAFLRLAEFMQSSQSEMSVAEKEFLETVASVFSIEKEEYDICLAFTTPAIVLENCDSQHVLVVSSASVALKNSRQFIHNDLAGQLFFLFLKRAQVMFFRYNGLESLTVNGQPADTSKSNVFSQGAVIRGPRIQALYYTKVLKNFLATEDSEPFNFSARNIEYVFSNGKKGIHDLSFTSESGTLAGIMGSSGAGKSTLLGILNGSSKPSSGNVLINGVDLYEQKGLNEGLIGNIPQDDLLIEELTVYQNLYYNTKLCFRNLEEIEIEKKVNDVLDSLGLLEIKNLKVGNVLNKTISGGQRKRLNIGLELVREPSILFVDEPTSGLSSRDAENVMDLLKQLALNGKLVFVVIHQPSSDIFRMFDQLLMLDTGGFPVYYGNPSDAMIYFKRQVHLTDSEQSECPICGNINPEQLFNIIELHEVDEFGNNTDSRRITPKDWNELYKKNIHAVIEEKKTGFTQAKSRKASSWGQWKIFFTRDFIARLSNKQYMLINLLEAPVLALVLGFILRYSSGVDYQLISNPNLPAYLFIGVIVALFLGLSVSAEEIIRDRKIQQREKFLHLSRTSYLLSKVSLLFIISAIQSATFVIIGNWVMGIHDMNLSYWIILFSTSCFANLLGLNISAGLDSAVTVYILIPFLLIPQILLSGVIVRFEKLHPAITREEGVPLIGNVMASRWAYEALSVEQFANNPFEKKFFPLDAVMSRATYKKDWWVSAMRERLDKCDHLLIQNAPADSFATPLKVLAAGFEEEASLHAPGKFPFLETLKNKALTRPAVAEIRNSLDQLREYYIDQFNAASEKKETLIGTLTATPEKESEFNREKSKYQNESLEEMVRSSNQKDRLVITKEKIIQRFEPIYHLNASEKFFQAPLFSSVKFFNGTKIDTLSANIFVIWLMTIVLYFTLQVNLFRKVIGVFSK
jgi:ABC-type multidrug transport system ATPase subunit